MKLASLNSASLNSTSLDSTSLGTTRQDPVERNVNHRDGILLVVDKKLQRAVTVGSIANTLISALENWERIEPQLQQVYQDLCQGRIKNSFDLDISQLCSPLPRSPQWLDGSAYLPHVRRVRKARGAEMPESFSSDPLMYQGASDSYLRPTEDIPLLEEAWGCDFEAEIAIVTDDVPMATRVDEAGAHIKLLMLVNDVSLRNLIPQELGKGFGFIHGKPSSSFSPVAVTVDELGDHWHHGKCHLPLLTLLNEQLFGTPNAGDDMQFNFDRLIAHAAKSRCLTAGTIIGSGTVSNNDESKGASCLVEKRVIEIIKSGKAITPFLKVGDRIQIEMKDTQGQSIFGAIKQQVSAH